MTKATIKPFSDKKGGVLVFFAVALIVLMGMAGLAVDVAHLYGVKSQLQVAADAAALAGANALTGPTAASDAAASATTVAAANYADADSSGNPVKVTLNSGDITTGNWDGATFKANGNPLNAVEVVVKRTTDNWFIKVMSLLPGGPNFAQTSVSAAAIACRTKLPLTPIAVNEYVGPGINGTYPRSYMRGTNVDGSPGLATGTATSAPSSAIFPFFGAGANNNNVPKNPDGFVCLGYRCPLYSGAGTNWYSAAIGAGNCSDPLTGPTGAPSNGDVNPQKGTYKGYLNTGIPDGLVPANAVREPAMSVSDYSNDALRTGHYVTALNSQSPFATLTHFSVGGSESGIDWTVGQKLLVMVYDGHTQEQGGLGFLTVVGYGIVQVDSLGPPTWTAHAIPHGIIGLDDPYIIQPSLANKTPGCSDLMLMLEKVQQKFPAAKLVGSNESVMHYGMANH